MVGIECSDTRKEYIMQLRNLLNAGDFVTPIPVGIPITLQYKDTGNLESLYLGHITDFDSISTSPKLPEVYSACVNMGLRCCI